MNIYVIRHGQTIINARNQVNGHNDIGLTEDGKKQAELAAEKIKDLEFDTIICSPLERTKETAEIVNINKINIVYDNRLIERDSKSMQYKPISSIDIKAWYDVDCGKVYSDVETFESVSKRTYEFLDEIKRCNYSDVLLVTHEDVCIAINKYFEGCNPNYDIYDFDQRNCEIIKYTMN